MNPRSFSKPTAEHMKLAIAYSHQFVITTAETVWEISCKSSLEVVEVSRDFLSS